MKRVLGDGATCCGEPEKCGLCPETESLFDLDEAVEVEEPAGDLDEDESVEEDDE
jgi:hypothetical protein